MNTSRINALFTSSRYNKTRDTYRAVLIAACESAQANAYHYTIPLTDRSTSFSIGDLIGRMKPGYEIHDIIGAIRQLWKDDYLDSDDQWDFQYMRISDATAELVTSDEEEALAA